jgi:hypothetical protein
MSWLQKKDKPKVSAKEKERRKEAVRHGFEWLIVYGSLGALLLVELALQIVSMTTIAPGPIERIGFGAIGFIMVALLVPAARRGFHALWIVLALCIIFINSSFVLESTRVQSNAITTENDIELKRLDGLLDKKNAALADLQSQFKEAIKQETMDKLNGQITDTRTELSALDSDRRSRFNLVESGNARPIISADDVFMAIPAALGADRLTFPVAIVKLIFFGALFIAMQLAILAFARDKKKYDKKDGRSIVFTLRNELDEQSESKAFTMEKIYDKDSIIPNEPVESNDFPHDGLSDDERVRKLKGEEIPNRHPATFEQSDKLQ